MKLLVGALAALSVAIAVPASASATTCSAGHKSAVIGGKKTCLGPGESCNEADNTQYSKYGYLCEYLDGKHRLKRSPTEVGKY